MFCIARHFHGFFSAYKNLASVPHTVLWLIRSLSSCVCFLVSLMLQSTVCKYHEYIPPWTYSTLNTKYTANSNVHTSMSTVCTPCLKKICAKLFLSELRQISTNFDNFWQKDNKEAKIMRGVLISASRNSCHHTTVLNADVPNCYITV